MRKLSLMFIAMLILVVMVFAMTHGTALGMDEPGVVADAKAKSGKPLCAEAKTCAEEKKLETRRPSRPSN